MYLIPNPEAVDKYNVLIYPRFLLYVARLILLSFNKKLYTVVFFKKIEK